MTGRHGAIGAAYGICDRSHIVLFQEVEISCPQFDVLVGIEEVFRVQFAVVTIMVFKKIGSLRANPHR